MIRLIAVIAFVSMLVSVVCLSVAVALGGRDIAAGNWWFPDDWHVDIDDHHGHRHFRHDRDRDSDEDRDEADAGGPTITRELAWGGGDALEVRIPAEVRYTQGSGPAKLTITGPRGAVENVELDGERLRFDEPMGRVERLTVIMTAPAVTRFKLQGNDRLVISGYRQSRLDIDMSGSAEVTAEGEAQALDIDISGSGEGDFGRLAAQSANVEIAGAGRATIAPRNSAEIDISGSGEVTLLTRPASVRSEVSGSGRIVQAGEAAETQKPPQPVAPAAGARKS